MTVCYYHVKYTFQSESKLYICLDVKELLARNRRDIWSLSDCNGTRTHNHLVRKRTLNHLAKMISLAKWLSVRLPTKWLWVQVSLQSLKKFLFWDFSEWKIWYFLRQKIDGKMIFTDYWKVLAFTFRWWELWSFLGQEVDGKDYICWLLKRFCFALSNDEKYGLFLSQEVDGKDYSYWLPKTFRWW